MKKTFIMALACSFFAVNASAQTETYYGGQEGGFAISLKAEPVINFAGNVLNGTMNNELDTEELAKTVAAKYFVSDNLALTAQLDWDNSRETSFQYGDSEEPFDITGRAISTSKDFEVRVGIQNYFRPGKRLQPFFGANILYGRTNNISNSLSYEFENDFIEQHEAQHKTSSPTNTLGLTANLGVELFLSKNISLSTCLDLGIKAETSKSISKYDTEDRDIDDDYIDARNYNKKTSKSLSLATGQMRGNLALNFYF